MKTRKLKVEEGLALAEPLPPPYWGDYDRPLGSGEAEPTWSPLDFVTPQGVKAGWSGLVNMGEEGALKLPWPNVKRIIGDLDPNEYSKPAWGRILRDTTGENLRGTSIEMLGAQAMDELKSGAKAEHIINKALTKKFGGSHPKVNIMTGPAGEQALASYNPITRNLIIDEQRLGYIPTKNKDLYLAGVARHEAKHAEDYLADPRTFKPSTRDKLSLGWEALLGRENFIERPLTTKSLAQEGFLSGDNFAAILEHAKDDPSFMRALPKEIQAKLRMGFSPKEIVETTLEYPAPELAKIVRQAYGTKSFGGSGFSGSDPYLIDRLQSGRHFKGVEGNIHLPVDLLLQEEMRHGGEVAPQWMSPGIEEVKRQYKSPAWRGVKK